MTETYLLDTSAYRALSSKTMEKLHSRNIRLVTSPYCFWELLTHLEDDGQFNRFKGRFMNFRFLEVLDDPLAQIKLSLGVKDVLLQERVPDTDIIYGALAALREANDIEQFYAYYVKDSNGNLRQLQDSVKRINEILANEEERFSDFIENIISSVEDGLVRLDRDEDYRKAFFELVDGQIQVLREHGANANQLRDKVIEKFFFYFSMIIQLARQHYGYKSRIDMNDYEDSRIVLHLGLNARHNFVTEDKKLFRLLEETQKHFKRLPFHGFSNLVKVLTTDQLKAECRVP